MDDCHIVCHGVAILCMSKNWSLINSHELPRYLNTLIVEYTSRRTVVRTVCNRPFSKQGKVD